MANTEQATMLHIPLIDAWRLIDTRHLHSSTRRRRLYLQDIDEYIICTSPSRAAEWVDLFHLLVLPCHPAMQWWMRDHCFQLWPLGDSASLRVLASTCYNQVLTLEEFTGIHSIFPGFGRTAWSAPVWRGCCLGLPDAYACLGKALFWERASITLIL